MKNIHGKVKNIFFPFVPDFVGQKKMGGHFSRSSRNITTRTYMARPNDQNQHVDTSTSWRRMILTLPMAAECLEC